MPAQRKKLDRQLNKFLADMSDGMGRPERRRAQAWYLTGLLDDALSLGLSPRIVLADSGYGDTTQFRDALVERNCTYLIGIPGNHMCWPPGSRPRAPKRKPGQQTSSPLNTDFPRKPVGQRAGTGAGVTRSILGVEISGPSPQP